MDVEWYDQLLADALNLNREELDSLEPIQKFFILILRQKFSREALQTLTGEDVVVISIEEGWLDLDVVEQLEITEIDVGIVPSSAFVTFADTPVGSGMLFHREGGRHWKVSLLQFVSWENQDLQELLNEDGLFENQFFTVLLEYLSGKPVDERIFDGPIQ
ncbi:MAG: hypothetical protein H6652_09070 [Ardenticatenaceae bacterium]|nr:hypothetical protein [Ardenticatenaceae bacterium]